MSGILRHENAYDDVQGFIETGLAGGNQWNVKNIRDTLVPLQYLRNNSSDFYCMRAQNPHWRKQGVNAKGLHIHYLLDAAYTGNETLVFDIYYTWVIPGTVFPALTGWTQLTGQSIVLSTGNLDQYHTGIVMITPDLPPPSPDGYGSGLVARVVRGNGTYAGELGIFWMDFHAPKDRPGSANETTD